MDEDIKEFFLSMADELRTAPDAPSDFLLRRVRRRRLRTVGAAVLALAIISAGTFGAISAFGGVHRPAPAQGACSHGWTAPENPASKLNGSLLAASGTSPDDVWAVGSVIGNPSYPIVEHWDGLGWSTVRSPRLLGAYLDGVTAVSSTDVWAVGGREGTLVEHWDGERWTVVPSPNYIEGQWKYNNLIAVAGRSADDVWTVGWTTNEGGRHARALIEHWNGSSWTLVSPPLVGSTQVLLNDVAVVGTDDVWAVGQLRASGSTETLAMHWDGSAWTVVPTPNPEGRFVELSGVVAVAPDDAWAVGSVWDEGLKSAHPIVMRWDGSAWSLVHDLPSGLPYGLEAVAAAGPNDVWAADKAVSYAYALHWDGRRWSLVAPADGPIKGGRLSGIVAFPSGEAVAVGSSSVRNEGMRPLAVQLCIQTAAHSG